MTAINEETLFDQPLEEVIPILPLRNMVLFPSIVLPVSVGRKHLIPKQEEANGIKKRQIKIDKKTIEADL